MDLEFLLEFNEENFLQNALYLCKKEMDKLHEYLDKSENDEEFRWINKTYLAFSYAFFTSLLEYAPVDVIIGFKEGFEKRVQESIENKRKGESGSTTGKD